MMQRLPRWVEWGGFLLAMNAGYINAVGVLGFRHQAVSHLTGISTYFSIELVNQDAWQVLHLLWVILFFVLGAILSGVLIGNEALRIGRRYHVALWLEQTKNCHQFVIQSVLDFLIFQKPGHVDSNYPNPTFC